MTTPQPLSHWWVDRGLTENVTSCPPPFLDASKFPPHGGQINGRFCADPIPGLTCCLPCPLAEWVFSDAFFREAVAANWVAVASFICQALLLITYVVLPEEKSHRHYLSAGLTLSLLFLSVAFIIPLSTHPKLCYNEITPNNMYTDLSCAWSGALLNAGAIGTAVWILLRSVWTFLRIVFDFKRTELFRTVSLAVGIGMPIILLCVSMPITGVAYRLGNVCIPNFNNAFQTWFIYLIIVAASATLILIITVLFCLWKFALSALAGTAVSLKSRESTDSGSEAGETSLGKNSRRRAMRRRRRVEWGRVKRVLILQWRTIVLAFITANETIYYSLVFVQETNAVQLATHGINPADEQWGVCLIETGGDKVKCLAQSGGLGISGTRAVATLLLASSLGAVLFLVMVRGSMIEGWYDLLRHPGQLRERLVSICSRRRQTTDCQENVTHIPSPKHISLGRVLESDQPSPTSTTPAPPNHVGGAGHRVSLNAVMHNGEKKTALVDVDREFQTVDLEKEELAEEQAIREDKTLG